MIDLLAELFSSKIRAAVLSHILPQPYRGFSLTELSRALEIPISSLQHECYKLERIGVLRGRREGNSRRYRVDPDCPIRGPLTRLIHAVIGYETALADALDGLPGLELAFLAGPVPPAVTGEPSHLVLVGDLALEALDRAYERVLTILDAPPARVELAFYRPSDWHERVAQRNALIAKLLRGPRLDLTPGEERRVARREERVGAM